MLEDDVEETAAVLRIVERAGNQSFGKTLNRGERGAEFVGDVGDKIPANALEFAKFRDVVEHDDGAGCIPGANGIMNARSAARLFSRT